MANAVFHDIIKKMNEVRENVNSVVEGKAPENIYTGGHEHERDKIGLHIRAAICE